MQFLKEWINNVATFLIFIALLNIIVTSKSYKKYVSLVVGFIFILILISPITKIFKTEFTVFTEKFLSYAEATEKHEKNISNQNTQKKRDNAIMEIYKANLVTQVKNLISSQVSEVSLLKVDVSIDVNESNKGQIKDIWIYCDLKRGSKQATVQKIQMLIGNYYSLDKTKVHCEL